MIYIVWQTQKWEEPYYVAAFTTESEAEECVKKIKTEAAEMTRYSLDKGYINFEVKEAPLFDLASDSYAALKADYLI